jgi:hypothetical protein
MAWFILMGFGRPMFCKSVEGAITVPNARWNDRNQGDHEGGKSIFERSSGGLTKTLSVKVWVKPKTARFTPAALFSEV